MNGHQKEQTSFARVSGYVEQNDVHSPQTTVREALDFSAQLRFAQGVPADTIQAFVDEVMGLVELTPLQHGLVRPLLLCALAACPSLLLPPPGTPFSPKPVEYFNPSPSPQNRATGVRLEPSHKLKGGLAEAGTSPLGPHLNDAGFWFSFAMPVLHQAVCNHCRLTHIFPQVCCCCSFAATAAAAKGFHDWPSYT